MENLQYENTTMILKMIADLQAQMSLLLAALVNKSIFSTEEGFDIENKSTELSNLIFKSSLAPENCPEAQKLNQEISELVKCIGKSK